MTSPTRILISFLCFLATVCLAPAGTADAAAISGAVFRADDGKPVADLTVTAQPTAGITVRAIQAETGKIAGENRLPAASAAAPFSAKTMADGAFSITGLPPGAYAVRADTAATELVGMFYGGALEPAAAQAVLVSEGRDADGIDFRLPVGGVINGLVRPAAGGEPLGGVKITVTHTLQEKVMRSAVTDAKGAFSINGLPSGRYLVSAAAGAPYVDAYFGRERLKNQAATVPVVAGQTTGGIDFPLERQAEVSGRLTEQGSGQGVAGVRVWAYVAGTPSAPHNAPAFTNSGGDGTFRITGLPPGKYRIETEARERWVDAVLLEGGQTRETAGIRLTDGEKRAGVNLVLPPAGAATGKVVRLPEESGLGGIQVQVVNTATGLVAATAHTAPDGAFAMKQLPPATYLFQASGQGYTAGYYKNATGPDTATPVIIEAGKPQNSIDFALIPTLAEGRGGISGRLTRAVDGKPAGGICLFAYIFGTQSVAANACTDNEGAFSMQGLEAGNYRVCTNAAKGYINACYAGAGRTAAAEATPVIVDAGRVTAGIDMQLTGTGSITGTLRWAEDGLELGGYRIEDLPPGAYRVEANAGSSGYADAYHGANGGAVVTVSDSATASAIDITLPSADPTRPPMLAGTVTTKAEVPLAGVPVTIQRSPGTTEKWIAFSRLDGSWRLPALPPGEYRVGFEQAGQDYLPVWHQRGTDEGTVAMRGDIPVTGIRLTLVSGGAIGGKVTRAADNTPVEGLTVCADPEERGQRPTPCATTRIDGTYSLYALAPGVYRGRTQTTGGPYFQVLGDAFFTNARTVQEAKPFTVAAEQTVPGIDFSLAGLGEVTGRVTGADGKTGIAGVGITVFDAATRQPVTTVPVTSGQDGVFRATGLFAGSYLVRAGGDGGDYLPGWQGGAENIEGASVVEVATAVSKSIAAISVRKGGSIGGVVRAAAGGRPLERIVVIAQKSTDGQRSAMAVTGADGAYRLRGLAAGSYKVSVMVENTAYIPQFYDKAADANSAGLIELAAGVDKGGIDFALVQGASLSGKVTSAPDGRPLAGATVQILPQKEGGTPLAAATGPDGLWLIRGLASGSYFAQAMAPGTDFMSRWHPDAATRETATPVEVKEGKNVGGTDFRLPLGSVLAGTVKGKDGVAVPGAGVLAYSADTNQMAATVTTGTEGKYRIGGLLPGGYRLLVSPGGESDYVQTYYERSVTADKAVVVHAVEGAPKTGVDFTLMLGGRVSGRLMDAKNGGPAAGLWVYAEYFDSGATASATQSKADGTFLIRRLAPGDYRLHVIPAGKPYRDTYFGANGDAASATRVTVMGGEEAAGIEIHLAGQ